ncbi:MAG: peptide ABC transporter substrate-binding protein [Bacilli bacterium]
MNTKKFRLATMAALAVAVIPTGCVSTAANSDLITVCLASEPQHVDPALNSAVDGGTMDLHLFAGLYRYVDKNGDGLSEIAPDLAIDAEPVKAENTDGSVSYTFTLRDGIKFSDGTAIVASDFVKSWKRAGGTALGADYGYMFDMLTRDEEGEVSGVEAIDDTHLKVTCQVEIPYFKEILAFPAFVVLKDADKADVVDATGAWAMTPGFVTSGAYKITAWTHEASITTIKNDTYWDAENIKMKSIVFALSDDTTNMLTNYENGSYQLIDDMPLAQLQTLNKRDDYHLNGQLGTYYVSFNMDSQKFNAVATTEPEREKVRQGLGLLIDRNNIVDNVAQGGQTPANSFVPSGLTDADGTSEFVSKNGEDGKGGGYYSVKADDYSANVAEGIALLKEVGYAYDETAKKFTNFPSLEYIYNTSDSHKAIGEAIQADLADVGITLELQNSDWNVFLDTRKKGDFDISRNGWLADFNDPITFLDMWTTSSGNNDCQFGKDDKMGHSNGLATYAGYSLDLDDDGTLEAGETGLTWAQSYDAGIAAVKASGDSAFRYSLMHKLETLLMSTGAICPVYFYTDIYLLKENVKGFYYSPLGYKFFMNTTIEA